MTLNGVMVVILHYFTDGSFGVNYVCDENVTQRIYFTAMYDLQ